MGYNSYKLRRSFSPSTVEQSGEIPRTEECETYMAVYTSTGVSSLPFIHVGSMAPFVKGFSIGTDDQILAAELERGIPRRSRSASGNARVRALSLVLLGHPFESLPEVEGFALAACHRAH